VKQFTISLMGLCVLLSNTVQAEESNLTLSLGGFNVERSASAMIQVENQFSLDWVGFKPHIGLFVTEDSAAYLYGGIGYPISINKEWSFNPSVSVGYYNDGADLDLGYDVEFYTQLRLNYQLSEKSSLGIAYGHISNLDLGDENPGADTAYISYSFNY